MKEEQLEEIIIKADRLISKLYAGHYFGKVIMDEYVSWRLVRESLLRMKDDNNEEVNE